MSEHGIHLTVISKEGMTVGMFHEFFDGCRGSDDIVPLADDTAGIVVKDHPVGPDRSFVRLLIRTDGKTGQQ